MGFVGSLLGLMSRRDFPVFWRAALGGGLLAMFANLLLGLVVGIGEPILILISSSTTVAGIGLVGGSVVGLFMGLMALMCAPRKRTTRPAPAETSGPAVPPG